MTAWCGMGLGGAAMQAARSSSEQEMSLVFSLIITIQISQWHHFIIENICKGCWASFI